MTITDYLRRSPLIAILRGVTPDEVVGIGTALVDAGVAIVEVPLNSPQPLLSIERLARVLGDRALIGAGTVMSPADVTAVAEAGGRLIVMPHSDPRVIAAAKAAGLVVLPGVATPTEAFAALAAGADGLKMFPGEAMPPAIVKAWRAVMPPGTLLIPVGGIDAGNARTYLAASANGLGIGSALYKPGLDAAAVAAKAKAMVAAVA